MMMLWNNDNGDGRVRAFLLVALMLLSTTAASMVSASTSRSYTTDTDPVDIALGDFDCDGDLDIVTANDNSLKISVLWNEDGQFSRRSDIWTSANTSQNAGPDDFSNTQQVEVGEFTGDSAPDIVIYARNRPFARDASGVLVVDTPGNVTIIENDGCSVDTFSIGQRFDVVYMWDLAVADLDQDGNDDIVTLELLADVKNQRVMTYMGPITSTTTGHQTLLGDSTQNAYRDLELGDWGETSETDLTGGSCDDNDLWLVRAEGVDYLTSAATNPGKSDNVTVIEFSCMNPTQGFPTSFTWNANGGTGFHVHALGPVFGGFDIGDMNGNGIVDVVAINDGNTENVTYATITEASHTYALSKTVYFGPYIAWTVTIGELNGDGEPDFIHAAKFKQSNSTDSTGGTTSSYYLDELTSVQVTLSNGAGGHMSPLEYLGATRPTAVTVGQVIGGPNSAPDLIVGHGAYDSTTWDDNWGWDGQYDRIIVIEMDNKDLAVDSIKISPTDAYVGALGEGTRDVEVTVRNTGMDILNGQATLDVEIKEVDEAASTNQTVYEMDWDSAEDKSGCTSGCTWSYEAYHGVDHWHEETNHTTGQSSGLNSAQYSANANNPTDFMWSGTIETDSNGTDYSGYGSNWDEGMTLNDVDLTGSDRAWMSAELFRSMSYAFTWWEHSSGQPVLADVWDDLAIIEVFHEDTGWSTLNCPSTAYFAGQCPSTETIWGGMDNERLNHIAQTGYAEAIQYAGIGSQATHYGWTNFTEEGVGSFDLSRYAGEIVDIRFRFKSGWLGSNSYDDENRWTGLDGFAIDNLKIWKQNPVFVTANTQTKQSNINMNNLAPNDVYTSSISADFENGTTYRISAVLNYAADEQPANDDIIGYVTAFNIFDPAIRAIDSFEPGGLYAEGLFPIDVVVEHLGNTNVSFNVEAEVFSALPADVFCGASLTECEETFEGGATGFRYEDDNNPNGGIIDDSNCAEVLFGSNSYWYGHPCDNANSFGDVWENETMTIPNIDLTNMTGDFVALNFDYFAETWFEINSDGNIYNNADNAALTADWNVGGTDYSGVIQGEWIDYNEDGFCIIDENGNGFIEDNETTIDNAEVVGIGDPTNVNGGGGRFTVFFDSDGLVKSRSLDLTHIYMLNTTDSTSWTRECMSLAGSTVDINFEFRSNDDGHNGQSDGVRGIAFDNISLDEFTFTSDQSYLLPINDLDAEENRTVTISDHDFVSGVYKIEVRSVFDNTTQGTAWEGHQEVSTNNNLARVIFSVESVDIVMSSPNQLSCLDDVVLDCVLPIDSALTHDWEIAATNGVLQGEYTFHMSVVDLADGLQVHTTTSGPSQVIGPHERVSISFNPWNGWQDGQEYNISYYATLSDGSSSGNVRYFHAGFADSIDVAILSGDTTRTATIKEDLTLLGMSYTQYDINDWDDYLDLGWLAHYDKVLMPLQEVNTAKPSDAGGKGYYEKIGLTSHQNALKNFMSSGGTLQVHLGGATDYYEYSSSTGESLLPFDMDIQPRDSSEEQITYNNMDLADPYHPIMDGIDVNAFQGFDQFGVVTEAVINTKSASATSVPRACNGYSEEGGGFQRIIQTEADAQDTVIGVCSYVDGGMIVTTIDVSAVSERADSTTFPLLGNMLSYQVSPYPQGFGTLGNQLDLTINGEVPTFDPSTGGYAYHFMKSDSQVTFGYTTATSETLSSDWVMSGPTDWAGNSMATGTDHVDEMNPTSTFCKVDFSSATGCLQGATWEVTLFLHDSAGHGRSISVTVMTDDVRADEYRPTANAVIDMRAEYEDQIEAQEPQSVSGVDWPKNRIQLGENGEVTIHFDASNSSDLDALEGDGINSYEWTVLFDKPYDDDEYKPDGHAFILPASSEGEWAYNFRNITVDPSGQHESVIRIELQVVDKAGKISDKYKMYFSVVPEGFGDAAPEVQIDLSSNGSKVTGDTITISGNVLSGSEQGDVYIEVALSEDAFSQAAAIRYILQVDGKWSRSDALGNNDGFELTLKIDDLFNNVTNIQRVYVQIYEGDSDHRWTVTKWIEIRLAACQGLEAPSEVLAAEPDAYWIWENDECIWSGDYEIAFDSDGNPIVTAPESKTDGANSGSGDLLLYAGGGFALVLIIILSLFFVMKGGSDDETDAYQQDFNATAADYGGVAQLDPMEQYVQQLIAQGYPEETARAYAAQYAGHFQQ
jgi:hypothetical protein